jgi:hypothetical protein
MHKGLTLACESRTFYIMQIMAPDQLALQSCDKTPWWLLLRVGEATIPCFRAFHESLKRCART